MSKNNDEKLSSLRTISDKKIINIIRYFFYFLDGFFHLFLRTKDEINSKKQVIIIANLGLGDAMNMLSVTDKYRKYYSSDKYEITMVVPRGIDKLMLKETNFDNIVGVNFNECVFNIIKRYQLFYKLAKIKYDILIDAMGITGTSINMYLNHFINAKEKITIINKKINKCPDYFVKRVYNKVFYLDDIKISNIELYNRLYENITDDKKNNIVFHKTINYALKNDKIPQKYYIVFPSASANVKKWNYENYAKIIHKIYTKTKLTVLFCGTNQDLESINGVISYLDVPYVNIIGETDVLEFIQVIKNAQFVITNDTSSYHIAVNEEIPVAIITGSYTYDGYVAYNFKNNNYRKPYPIVSLRDCHNCYFNCPYSLVDGKWPCLSDITVDYAWNIIKKMIEDNYEQK